MHSKIGVKEYDAIVDGFKTEFKTVTGSLSKVAASFSDGIGKAQDVFLKIDKHYSNAELYQALLGKLNRLQDLKVLDKKNTTGYVYIYKTDENLLYKWSIKKMLDDLK